jgi:dTDP-4-amino-4,6-dideoxygalactose transaminase
VNVPFADLNAQYNSIKEEVLEEIYIVLESSSFILGPKVEEFEKKFSKFCGSRFCVGVDSGLSAIQLSLLSAGVGPGDEVITAANTFIATASAISFAGARPVLVDIDPETYNMDPSQLSLAITEKTKAVIPVHLYGQPADMDPILEISEENDLTVIEDACQAHGATYRGKRAGSIGDAGCFSFYPGKNLGAYGDGGAIVTDYEELAHGVRTMRNYGQDKKYHHIAPAYNKRLDSLQAAVLVAKLRHLEEWNAARQKNAAIYDSLLSGSCVITPFKLDSVEHVYHLYVIRSEERDELMGHLNSHGISCGLHYPIPVHLHPVYENLGYMAGSFPASEKASKRILSLPIVPEISGEQIQYVAECIHQFDKTRKTKNRENR